MAKKKGPRLLIRFKCRECGKVNYTSEKSRVNSPDKLLLKKFCPKCRRHTEHVEIPIK